MKTQKELKELYAEILNSDVWRNDKKMVDYCVKKADYIVELEDGSIIEIEKPSIQKDFCFGYSDSRYDTEDYDRANNMADYASKNTDYFMEKNLKDINRMINLLEGKETSRFKFYICIPYTGQPNNSKLKSLQAFHEFDEKEYPKLEGENLKRVIEGYKTVKANFEKRLNTYLKKYGLTKVNTWSYWRDA